MVRKTATPEIKSTSVRAAGQTAANDPIFAQEGARAFQRDLKDAELHMLDTGHFALEDHCDEIAAFARSFYERKIEVRKAA